MKIYLAALWSKRDEMRVIAQELTARGHIITSRWLDDKHTQGSPAECASIDLVDIDCAESLMLFSAGPRGTMFSGGGRCIEFGYALAADKKLFLIGPIESVFHELPRVKQFNNLEEFLSSDF